MEFRQLIAAGAVVVAVAATTSLAPSSAVGATSTTIAGRVTTVAADGAVHGWSGWTVDEMVAGIPTPVSSGAVAEDGSFAVTEPVAVPVDAVRYLLARAPRQRDRTEDSTAVLAAVVPAHSQTIIVNERTTISAAWAMAQFISDAGVAGEAPGLGNAAAMTRKLTDPETGATAAALLEPPNGTDTSTLALFGSLTAALASCVSDPFADLTRFPRGACEEILAIASTGAASEPVDTFRALASIARAPSADPQRLFDLSTTVDLADDPPVLRRAPVAWTLALRFDGDGRTLSGPGNFALDEKGNIWITNNYEYAADPHTPVCGSQLLLRSSPTGDIEQFSGGGLSGAGFGIARDVHTGEVWVANYGFAAPEPDCPADRQPPHDSVTLFDANGAALSDEDGFSTGEIAWPQGTIVGPDGTAWFANCNNGTLTAYPHGDPTQPDVVDAGELQLDQPFGIADNGSALFITGIVNNAVRMVSYDGTVLPASPGPNAAFDRPLGVAAGPDGSVWVANSAVITLPCPDQPNPVPADPQSLEAILESRFDDRGAWTGEGVDPYLGSIARIAADGSSVQQLRGGGLTVPWGITTDGVGNVWVANFAGQRLSEFCGNDPSTCPIGVGSGQPISPAVTGFSFDGLVRNTGVIVDQAGNVWLANNWQQVPVQTNPGGHEIVAFLGLAAPVSVPAPDTSPPDHGSDGPGSLAPMLPATGMSNAVIPATAVGLVAVAIGAVLYVASRRTQRSARRGTRRTGGTSVRG